MTSKLRKTLSLLCALALLLTTVSVPAYAQDLATPTDLLPEEQAEQLPAGDPSEDAGESAPVVYDVAADRDISVPEELSQNTWTVSGTLTAEDPEFLIRIISERTLNTVLSLAADRPVTVSVVPEAGGKTASFEHTKSEEDVFEYRIEGYMLKEGSYLVSGRDRDQAGRRQTGRCGAGPGGRRSTAGRNRIRARPGQRRGRQSRHHPER